MGVEDGTKPFSKRLMGSTWLNVVLIIIVTLWVVLGIAEVVIGVLYIDDCSEFNMLPVWLIVDAAIPIFFILGIVLHLKEGSGPSSKIFGSVFIVIAAILTIGWSVCGGVVWIYPNWNDDGDCEKVVQIFCFAMITLNWVVIWMWANTAIRLVCIHCCKARGCIQSR